MTTYIDICRIAAEGDQAAIEDYAAQNPNLDWNEVKDESGNTILTCAAMTGKLYLVEWLFDQGAQVNIANNNGKVALDFTYPDHPNTSRGLIKLYEKSGVDVPLTAEQRQALAA